MSPTASIIAGDHGDEGSRSARRGYVRRSLIILVAASVACVLPTHEAVAAKSKCRGKHWVGIWSASPSDAAVGFSRSLAGATVRNVITPLGSGRKIRIRLSNAYSPRPLTVAAASIAPAADGAALSGGSPRPLTFAGAPSVTLPAGGEVVSDAVHLKVRYGHRLAVSIYVAPGSTGIVTEHYTGRQTSFVGSGDQTLDATGVGFTEETTARLVVSGAEARASRRVGAIATFGDSITDGFQGNLLPVTENENGLDEDARYPDYLAARFAGHRPRRRPTVLNAGISGNQVLEDGLILPFGHSGVSRLGRDVIGLAGVRTVIVQEGINDIGNFASATALIAGLSEVITALKRAGLRVLIGTLTPAAGTLIPDYGTPNGNATRLAVNEWIRSQTIAAGVVDFDAALRDPADPSRVLAAYDSSDHLHPSTAGYMAMARAVPLSTLRATGCR